MDKNRDCFNKILKLIDVLQRQTGETECIDPTCSRPFLGQGVNTICFNTRPVTFYGCDNNLISIEYTTDGVTNTSSVFRVLRVDDDCTTVSLLAPNPTPTEFTPYINTGQTAIINLDCVCAIKCLNDSIVN